MKRRDFLSATLAFGSMAAVPAFSQENERTYYELIRYEVLYRSKLAQLEEYWQKAAIPAFNRLGIEQIGVFRSKYGTHGLDLYVLIPHKNLASFATMWDKIAVDQTYQEAGKEFINTGMNDPLYYRFETSLLHAFSNMPKPEIPSHIKDKSSRIFEIRIYESHNRHKGKLKIEMFNEGGEIALFREKGLHPIIFAETLAGPKMPNLVYMLGFKNIEERDKNWNTFVSSDGWKNMKDNPRYADTVSSVTDIILRPSSCSQM
jgi:hypothetical protein